MGAVGVLQFARDLSEGIKSARGVHLTATENSAERTSLPDLYGTGTTAIGNEKIYPGILAHSVDVLVIQVGAIGNAAYFKAVGIFLLVNTVRGGKIPLALDLIPRGIILADTRFL